MKTYKCEDCGATFEADYPDYWGEGTERLYVGDCYSYVCSACLPDHFQPNFPPVENRWIN
jgi:hypothetical protein